MSTTGQEPHAANPVAAKSERQGVPRRTTSPYVDVYESKDAFVVTADVPGVAESALDITIEKDQLTIVARAESAPRDGLRLRRAEFASGDYQRSFTLPDSVDRERIEASFKNGVLRLTLPKSEAVRPRKIAIQRAA